MHIPQTVMRRYLVIAADSDSFALPGGSSLDGTDIRPLAKTEPLSLSTTSM